MNYLFLFLVLFSKAHAAFITYEFSSGGRLGDCLTSYVHAKWLSFQLKIPLLYRPFPYSAELLMDDLEESHEQYAFIGQTTVLSSNAGSIDPASYRIYSCPYFPI